MHALLFVTSLRHLLMTVRPKHLFGVMNSARNSSHLSEASHGTQTSIAILLYPLEPFLHLFVPLYSFDNSF